MEKEIFKRIINKISKIEVGNYADFGNRKYEPIKIDKSNFKEIISDEGDKPITFVDGGNAEIFSSPNISLQVIKVVSVKYKGKKRESINKKEYFCLITAEESNGLKYNCEFFPDSHPELTFDSFDKNLVQGNNRAEISAVANTVRRFLEIEIAEESVEGNEMVVLDGSLQATYTGEDKILDSFYQKAAKKRSVVCGLSKTSRLMTDKGYPFAAALVSIAPVNPWYYNPVAEFEDSKRKSNIYYIKLHPKSKYVFMLDVCKEIEYNIEDILGSLINLSTDPVFLGYPYGLIEADRIARLENTERDYLKQKFMAVAGKDSELFDQLSKTIDAHSVLDNVS